MLILKGQQIREAKRLGKIGIMLHGNTTPMIEDSVELLHLWYRLGMRSIILARAGRNLICDGWLKPAPAASSRLWRAGNKRDEQAGHGGGCFTHERRQLL